jgi:dienelactone hydrolase
MHPALALKSLFLAFCTSLILAPAHAQDLKEQLPAPLDLKPVTFAADTGDAIGAFTNIANKSFKPAGEGPFPAAVVMHTCGGIRNAHIRQHAQELLQAGYVVLVVDSYGPRGFEFCTRVPNPSTGIADAYAALAYLQAKPFVDKARVYQVGYSWGAMISTLLASPQSAVLAGSAGRFTGTVANYSTCSFREMQLVYKDADKPFLLLMGAEDKELPSTSCFPLLDSLKQAGAPVEWHIYPRTSHGWDKRGQADRGYLYDGKITDDATARMLAFFSKLR